MKKFTTIERDGTGIERDGTGIERDGTGIERDGTGIERDGTGIERDGTGIRQLSLVTSLCVALGMVSSVAFADPANLQISRSNDTITVSWFNNGELYVGRGPALGTQSAIALSKVPFDTPYFNLEVNGDGTGSSTEVNGDGTGSNKEVNGDGTGSNTEVNGDGTGSNTEVNGDGTGSSTDVNGDGTGVTSNGQFSFMVEINLGCQTTQATIYETGNFAAVEYIEINQPSVSAGVCNQGIQPISGKFNLGQ